MGSGTLADCRKELHKTVECEAPPSYSGSSSLRRSAYTPYSLEELEEEMCVDECRADCVEMAALLQRDLVRRQTAGGAQSAASFVVERRRKGQPGTWISWSVPARPNTWICAQRC